MGEVLHPVPTQPVATRPAATRTRDKPKLGARPTLDSCTPLAILSCLEIVWTHDWISRCRTEAGDAHGALVSFGGVLWLFFGCFSVPDNSER